MTNEQRAEAIRAIYSGNYIALTRTDYFWEYIDHLTKRRPIISELEKIRNEFKREIEYDYRSLKEESK